MNMGITRIKITNYRGIEALDSEVPPAGALICGDNGQGKTTVLNAIQAALTAQDIGPDAVRLGADKAEILVDIDTVSVRRAITKKASQLTVTNADGFKASAPQTFLREMLGASSLDPIAMFTLKPKERKAKIFEALPLALTAEQVRRWVPRLPDGFDSGQRHHVRRKQMNERLKDLVFQLADETIAIRAHVEAFGIQVPYRDAAVAEVVDSAAE